MNISEKGLQWTDEQQKFGQWRLLEKNCYSRIQDIRFFPKKSVYRQVLDIYATSIGLRPKSRCFIDFSKKV